MKAVDPVDQETIDILAQANGMRCGTWGSDAEGELKFYELPPHTWDAPFFLVYPRFQGGRQAATGGVDEVEMTDEQRLAFWRLQDEMQRILHEKLHAIGFISDDEMQQIRIELDHLDAEREALTSDERS